MQHQELNGEKVPQKKTVERWLEELDKDGVRKRIQEHLSYWQDKIQTQPLTVESIRTFITKELNDKNVPQKRTIEKWLEEYGQSRVQERVQEHISYWKSRSTEVNDIEITPSTKYNYSIGQPFPSNKTIATLLEEGYQGIDLNMAKDKAFAAAAYKFKDKIQWTKSEVDREGESALMTLQVDELGQLLEFMMEQFRWCPPIYSNKPAPEYYIFDPKDPAEEAAIKIATEGEKGWRGPLYSLNYVDNKEGKICLIFSIKPEDSPEQEWLLVISDGKSRSWSVHTGTIEQVYYIWAEGIKLSEPNYKPTASDILNAMTAPSLVTKLFSI